MVGGGVAGIVAAAALHDRHEVVLFEAEDYLGGHTHTVAVEREHGTWHVDTGFIVCNDRNYPSFRALLEGCGVALEPSHMGFSVRGEDEDFDCSGDAYADEQEALDDLVEELSVSL